MIKYSTTLCSLGSKFYDLRCPIVVVLSKFETDFLANWPEVELQGCGETEFTALMDLRQKIIDAYLNYSSKKESQLILVGKTIKMVLQKVVETKIERVDVSVTKVSSDYSQVRVQLSDHPDFAPPDGYEDTYEYEIHQDGLERAYLIAADLLSEKNRQVTIYDNGSEIACLEFPFQARQKYRELKKENEST